MEEGQRGKGSLVSGRIPTCYISTLLIKVLGLPQPWEVSNLPGVTGPFVSWFIFTQPQSLPWRGKEVGVLLQER